MPNEGGEMGDNLVHRTGKRAARHPAGATGVLAGALVVVAGRLGIELSAEEAVSLVSAAVLIVSWFHPLPE